MSENSTVAKQTVSTDLTLSDAEFNAIRELVHRKFGINLTDGKKSLVSGRLQHAILARGFVTFREYYNFVLNDNSGEALEELATRISTNHTFFFRESDHFDFFSRKALPEIVERNELKKDLRIWCAGCSSGEEAYTLTMLIMDYLGSDYDSWSAGLLATDISTRALTAASNGVYPADRVQALPSNLLRKYFKQLTTSNEWAVIERVKKEITFRRLNLMLEKFPFKKPFDTIFCRNVMIYFDQVTRDNLVRKLRDCLIPGGYLFIGHSETLRGSDASLSYIMPALYQRRD